MTKVFSFDEAWNQSLAYFNGAEYTTSVFISKYALRDNDLNILEPTPDYMHDRLASEFARIDAEKYGLNYEERFKVYRDGMDKFARIVPQGSPMSAVGNPYQIMSASNCVVIQSPVDSVEGIIMSGLDLAQLMKRRAGVGIDISTLRPDGTPVNNAARTTSGAWSFSDFFSYITRMIGQNSRRGALMITMDVHHPDIINFITMKHDKTKVTGANVSVRLSNEFLKAVETDSLYEQRWPCEGEPKIRKMISAKQVWNEIIESATTTAEPGLIMWDSMTENLPAHYYPQFKSQSTNPCCFDKDSDVYVITKNGIKEIKDIKNDDYIWIDENKCWAKTSGYFDAGQQEVFKVAFSNNDVLYITANHKLEKLTKISINDRKVEYIKELVELKDLQLNDLISLHTNEVFDGGFGNIGSFDDGVLLGWLTGDGCLSYKYENDIWPTMYLSCWDGEYDVADKLIGLAKKYTPDLNLHSYNDQYGNIVKRVVSHNLTRYITEKYQTNLWNFKAGYNAFLYNASRDFLKGYISSYFSADGTVADVAQNSRYAIQLTSIDFERLKQIKNILNLFGIISHVGLNKKADRIKIRHVFYECKNSYRLTISGYKNIKQFYDTIGFVSDRKQLKLENILSNFIREGRASQACVKIDNIQSIGIKNVGCIEVDSYHKFTANGIISGNSEICLSPYDSCRLISLNLTGYVRNAFEEKALFDFDLFKEDIDTAMQMIDNLVDIEIELIDKIKSACGSEHEINLWNKLRNAGEQGRRTGLGTHALADALAQLRIKYDSDESINMIDKIYSILRDSAYSKSIELAKVRGAFPAFDWSIEKNCPFIKRLPKKIQKDMSEYGRRNISILTQAPTGSVSAISKVGQFNRFYTSSGVEPVFRNFSIRRKKINPNDQNVRIDFTDVVGDKWQEYKIYHPNVEAYKEKFNISNDNELPEYFITSDQIDANARVKLQGTEQLYLDHSISSTLNLPKGTKSDVVGKLYIDAWKNGLKGITVYVEGSRDGVILSENETEGDNRIVPERQMTLKSETHKIKIDTGDSELKNAYITVSFFPDTADPYEVFINAPVASNMKDIQILEVASRLASLALRHGVPVEFVSKQLEKVDGQYLYSIPVSIAKALRSYIKADKKAQQNDAAVVPAILPAKQQSKPVAKINILGPEQEKRPNVLRKVTCKNPETCPSEKIYEEGCIRCTECPWSGCS